MPRWLAAAASFDLLDIAAGSTQLVVDAPPLRSAAPDHFAQVFSSIDARASALDLFQTGLTDALSGNLDSDYFDGPLLNTYEKLTDVLKHGFDELEFEDHGALQVNSERLRVLGEMQARVPKSRHVRVCGKLEQIQHSDKRFLLVIEGKTLRAVADESISPEQLASLFGQTVVVTGDAAFRPSGSMLRLDAVHIERAGEGASVWAKIPRPLFEAGEPASKYRVAQGPRSGLAAVLGKWPGEESDEEIAMALESMS